jgi:hypothetical protein
MEERRYHTFKGCEYIPLFVGAIVASRRIERETQEDIREGRKPCSTKFEDGITFLSYHIVTTIGSLIVLQNIEKLF